MSRGLLKSLGVVTAITISSLWFCSARAGTIAYYRFETGPAGTAATSIVDSSGSDRNGTILAGFPTYNSNVPLAEIPIIGQVDNFSMNFGMGAAASFAYAFPFQTL